MQLATVRFLGTFLAHPADVPPVVANTIARELAVDAGDLARYARREQTHREHAVAQLQALVRCSASTLEELCGLSTRSVAELLVEVGDPRRFTEGGFARFNGTAPLAASTVEGPGDRSASATTPAATAASTRSCAAWPSRSCAANRAKAIYEGARARGHIKREARGILKRHLSDVVYRRIRAGSAGPASSRTDARRGVR